MNFNWKPIIVEGVNHSGTRVLVQMLSIMGSDGGDIDNPYKENKFFLEIHKSLVGKVSSKGWSGTIFNLPFISQFRDDLRYRDDVYAMVKGDLVTHFPNSSTSPWHWKCPSSALFERTWTSIFPEAFYIHILRDPLECADSFLRRNQLRSIREGVEFCNLMNRKIEEVPKQNYLRVQYENLAEDIHRIRDFVPFKVDEAKLLEARSAIISKREKKYWYPEKSLKQNFFNLRAKLLLLLFSRSLRQGKLTGKEW